MIALFTPSVFGMWVPFLPLGIHSESSLQKGIQIFKADDRDLDRNQLTINAVSYSRIGLIGNPSDGYYGHTISITVDNFASTVTLLKSERLNLVPHPLYPFCPSRDW